MPPRPHPDLGRAVATAAILHVYRVSTASNPRPQELPWATITVHLTDDDRTYDDSAITASYAATVLPDGSIDVVVEVFDGTRQLASLVIDGFAADEATAFTSR
ncbi:hypothetical protein BN11_1540002 [Nostocoides australiense Ben110]|uniref:Uncharacterized protein n=1 Tax=Nostocoides australiense Ben110 TaxID=1193182 RepID=W6JTX5_9MICO|nr:hypothetical protein BN11_1540002 [Tetrasphaera australiensis Ben110]